MDPTGCENACMVCKSTTNLYDVNNSKIHKICNSCSSRLNAVNNLCQFCHSSIQIEFLKATPIKTACQKCKSPHGIKCASKHCFCVKCRIGANCPACICCHCHSPNVPLQGCQNHRICSDCAARLGEVCVYCFCISCGKNSQENFFQKCKHPACSDCVNKNSCKLCERVCFYCNANFEFEGSAWCYHFACKKCNEEIVSKLGCLECQQKTIDHKCVRCRRITAKTLQHCNTKEHRYCLDCTQTSANCDYCNSCAGCGLSFPLIKGKCNHMFCEKCRKKDSQCNPCKQPATKCSRCARSTDNGTFFSCKIHSACHSCLSTKEPCKSCTKICEYCGNSISKFTEFSCNHSFCEDCLKYKKCLKCFPLNSVSVCVCCKKTSNLATLGCIHTQEFCNACLTLMGSCVFCRLCKGCLSKKGKILNDSNHLVCKPCFDKGKCCGECNLLEKCLICNKRKCSLVQFTCNIHKGCQECKNIHKTQQCSVCNLNTCFIKSLNCPHIICENCKIKSGFEMCMKCLPKCCVCNKPVKKNSTCSHNICEECNRGNSTCGVCNKLISNIYCKTCGCYRFFLFLDCENHKGCGICRKKSSVCLECPRCTACKKQTAYISSLINDSEEIQLCEQCKPKYACSKCSNRIYSRSFQCSHNLCIICAPQNFCTICNSSCKICHANFNANNTCGDICTGCRNIFNGCIFCSQTYQNYKCTSCQQYKISVARNGNSLDCQDCSTKIQQACHNCNQKAYPGQKSPICGFIFCDKCSKYLSWPFCPVCNCLNISVCNNCNNTDFCFKSNCEHSLCFGCSAQLCRLCTACSVCKEPGNNNDKCEHKVCNLCYSQKGCYYCRGYLKCKQDHWYLKNEIENNGCTECTKFIQCRVCHNNFIEYQTRDGMCINCDKRLCGSCNSITRVLKKECDHYECEYCNVDQRKCAKCCELYRCRNHNQNIYHKIANSQYYYVKCCSCWICLKCRNVFNENHSCSN